MKEKSEVTDELLLMMIDLHSKDNDTLWLNNYETIFERLSHIYVLAGGDTKILIDKWPEYF